jgi:hypothetical protein
VNPLFERRESGNPVILSPEQMQAIGAMVQGQKTLAQLGAVLPSQEASEPRSAALAKLLELLEAARQPRSEPMHHQVLGIRG